MNKYSNLIIYPNEYMMVCECPNCGDTDQLYIETFKKPCNCIFKKITTVNVFECNNCKSIYGVKDE
ncbi:MAG: hypothetical protein ACRCW9_10055 [Cetobacterium sp.]